MMGIAGGATVPMVLAMGIANSILHTNGEVRFGVTYVTGALVKVGQRSADAANGGAREGWQPYAAIWLALEIGRANVCTPVTTEHLVCRLLLEKKQSNHTNTTSNTNN